MSCRVCGSRLQKAFASEINIHPPRGLMYLTSPCLFAFPELLVCLDCGFTELVLEENERNTLRQNYADGRVEAERERSTRVSRPLHADDFSAN